MMTTATTSRLCHQAWEYEPQTPGGIVVGVDGSMESIEALNAAATIARNKHRCLHAVTVVPPYPSYRITSGVDTSIEDVNKIRLGVKNTELSVNMNAPCSPFLMGGISMGHSIVFLAERRHSRQ